MLPKPTNRHTSSTRVMKVVAVTAPVTSGAGET